MKLKPDTKPQTRTRFNLISLLWGLILIKCFSLEFLVRHYEIPINSITYVWVLSITMAAIATWIYASLCKPERAKFLQSPEFPLVLSSGLLSAACTLFGLIFEDGRSGIALSCAALILALKHASLWLRLQRRDSRPLLFGWLAIAILTAYLGGPAAFLVFAFGLSTLWVLPSLAQVLASRGSPPQRKTGNY